jgi:hypothetical protein
VLYALLIVTVLHRHQTHWQTPRPIMTSQHTLAVPGVQKSSPLILSRSSQGPVSLYTVHWNSCLRQYDRLWIFSRALPGPSILTTNSPGNRGYVRLISETVVKSLPGQPPLTRRRPSLGLDDKTCARQPPISSPFSYRSFSYRVMLNFYSATCTDKQLK